MEDMEIKEGADLKETEAAVQAVEMKETDTSLVLARPFSFLDSFENGKVEYPIYLPSASPVTPQGAWDLPARHIAGILRSQGISEEHLKTGLITFLAMNSAGLGVPLGVEVIDDQQSGAIPLLEACSEVTPPENKIELSDVSLRTLVKEREQIRGRAIVGFNGEAFKKNEDILNLLLERQMLSWQETLMAKYGEVVQGAVVQGPVACVAVNKDPKHPILTYPGALRIQLNPEHLTRGSVPVSTSLSQNREELNKLDWQIRLVRSSIKRLRPAPVRISFGNQILQSLVASKAQHAQQKYETFMRLISAITLLNNPPPLYKKELWAKAIELDLRKITSGGRPVGGSEKELVSSKLDYYLFWLLMKDLVTSKEDSLTDRQFRIFETIKNINLAYVNVSTFPTSGSDADKLVAVFGALEAWVPSEKIFEYVNKGETDEINFSTLYREIQELQRKEVIRVQSDPKAKNKKLYAVTTLSGGKHVEFPRPSEIDDPIFEKRPVRVINPLTGMEETV